MKITAQQIAAISEDLQCGFNTYINRATYEVKSILDIESLYGDTEIWEEELEKLEKEWKNFFVIFKLKSWGFFKIMEDFVNEVDEDLQRVLVRILNNRRPFAHFKASVEDSRYRQDWFDFLNINYEKYIRERLEEEGIVFEED